MSQHPKNGEKVVRLRQLLAMPLFDSLVREALRHRTSGVGPRFVTEDMTIGNGRYLLKKGSIVIIPNRAMHRDARLWGDSVDQFREQRFTSDYDSRKIHPAAFRGLGGGANLCPGRTFATAEITALLSMVAVKYNVSPVEGAWTEPGQDGRNMSLSIAPPKSAVFIKVEPRVSEYSESWRFEL